MKKSLGAGKFSPAAPWAGRLFLPARLRHINYIFQ